MRKMARYFEYVVKQDLEKRFSAKAINIQPHQLLSITWMGKTDWQREENSDRNTAICRKSFRLVIREFVCFSFTVENPVIYENNRFTSLDQETFPKESEHTASNRNRLVSLFELLLLLKVQNGSLK